jgi:RNA polymerase sigma factor (sigma-70 family)
MTDRERSSSKLSDRRPAGGSMTWPPALPFALVLERARMLDQASIGLLYKRFLPVVYRYVLSRVAHIPQAEDVTADTFFAMIEGIKTTRAQDELGFIAWLLGIARNKVALHFRHLRGMPAFQSDLPEAAEPLTNADEDDPLTIITSRETWSEVVQALHRLTEEQRAVVLYRCILGYATSDVAQLLDKRPGTIRALQFRALASLARHLGLAERDASSKRTAPASQVRADERRGGHATRG